MAKATMIGLLCASFVAAAAPAEAQPRSRPDDRLRGPYVSVGVGLAVIDYDRYEGGDANPGIRFQLAGGWAVTPFLVALAQGSWGYTERTPYELRQATIGAGARLFFTRHLWAQAGAGLGWVAVKQVNVDFDSISAGPGPSLELTVGVDAVRSAHFSFGIEGRGSWTTHGDEGDVTTWGVLVDVSWY